MAAIVEKAATVSARDSSFTAEDLISCEEYEKSPSNRATMGACCASKNRTAQA